MITRQLCTCTCARVKDQCPHFHFWQKIFKTKICVPWLRDNYNFPNSKGVAKKETAKSQSKLTHIWFFHLKMLDDDDNDFGVQSPSVLRIYRSLFYNVAKVYSTDRYEYLRARRVWWMQNGLREILLVFLLLFVWKSSWSWSRRRSNNHSRWRPCAKWQQTFRNIKDDPGGKKLHYIVTQKGK